MSAALQSSDYENFIDDGPGIDPEYKALMRSNQHATAQSFWQAIPSRSYLELEPSRFKVAARLRLGVFPKPEGVARCAVHKTAFDMYGNHAMKCKAAAKRHDFVRDELYRIIRSANMTCEVEPAGLVEGAKIAPDLLLNITGGFKWLDVCIAHPTQKTYVNGSRPSSSVHKDEYALQALVKAKKYKYLTKHDIHSKTQCTLVVLAMESTGRLSTQVTELLNDIEDEAQERSGSLPIPAGFARKATARIGAAIQRMNAAAVFAAHAQTHSLLNDRADSWNSSRRALGLPTSSRASRTQQRSAGRQRDGFVFDSDPGEDSDGSGHESDLPLSGLLGPSQDQEVELVVVD